MEACTLISELCDAKCNEGTMKQKLKNFWYFVDFRNVPEVGPENCLQKLAVYSFFFFFWLDPLCASPFGPLCNTSGEAGIRGMPCGFMFCMTHSD